MKELARRTAALLTAASLTVAAGCGRESENGKAGESAPGVTSKPCPQAKDDSKGCIYLGVISDLTGAFKGVGVPYTSGQQSFWSEVNDAGGIGGYEVDVVTHVKDNVYDPDTHAAVYAEIKDDILALAQSLGTPQTNAILRDAESEKILIAPASLGSNWLFEDQAIEIGTSYCAEAMNSIDYAVDELGAKSVAAVHFPGDYGDDAMVGARTAAEAQGVKFTDISTDPGADKQPSAVAAIMKAKPDAVMVSTGPIELAAIVGGATAQGFEGTFIGSLPTWNSALLDTPARPALETKYLHATSFGAWDSDTPGHKAMRDAAGEQTPNDWYAFGWSSGYAMRAVLEQALEDGDLTREGVMKATREITSIDGKGMFPEGSGNWAGDPNEAATRATLLNKVDSSTSTGIAVEKPYFTGPTAEGHNFTEACYLSK